MAAISYEAKDAKDTKKYKPKDGDTLASIVTANPDRFKTWQDLAIYNWGTSEPLEVNRVLIETVGVSAVDAADPSKTTIKVHPDAKNPDLFLAKPWTATGLATGKTYVVQAQKPKPPTAIAIDSLDRWFIPEKESCELKYSLEGEKAYAKKVVFEVYGSNYSAPGAWNQGLGTFPAAADKKDVVLYTKDEQTDAAERAKGVAINEWKGKITATDGALGKKTPRSDGTQEDRVINVAFSPYTAHLRYFLDDADKNARIVLEPFWVTFDAANAPVAASLKVKWNVKGTKRFEGGKGSGQVAIVDGKGRVVFRKPLKDDELKEKAGGMIEIPWAGGTYNEPGIQNSKGGAVAVPEDMPYRVRVEMHTITGEAKGLGLAAMHTEVRLYVHPQTHALDLNPYVPTTDKPSLHFSVTHDLLATKPVVRADGTIWCKLQLAKGGFHPGPVDGDATHAAYKIALEEMKRSVPKRKANPADDFARFTIDATEGNDVKDALEDLTKTADWQRPWFGEGVTRADVDLPTATTTLNDSSKELVVWSDDRHTYTDPTWLAGTAQGPTVRTKVKSAPAATLDHMGSYTGGDNVIDRKEKSIPRPWIPVAVDVILLPKAADLTTVCPVPSEADLAIMRKAVGPLRVDWTFDEIDPDPPPETIVDVTAYDKRVTRSRAHAKDTLGANKATVARKDVKKSSVYHNCPTTAGGIRGAADYYKAIFGLAAKDILKPWQPVDVPAREALATIVHDNLGQTGDDLVAARIGQAGVFFRPSTMGGDSFRLRAQVFFEAQGGYKLPNLEVLKARYPKPPQSQSAAMRGWRKASVRAYVNWADENDWAASSAGTWKLFEPGYLHFVFERGDAAAASVITDWLADDASFRSLVKEALAPGAAANTPDGKRAVDAAIKLKPKRMWPWFDDPNYGLYEPSAPNATMANARSALLTTPINPLFYTLSNLLGLAIVNKIEATKGKLRGHVILQMKTSDTLYMQEYKCATCNKKYWYAEKREKGGSMVGKPCPTPACAGTLAKGPPHYYGYYTCTNGHKHHWEETGANIPNGGKFTGANCTTKGCAGPGTLNPDQVKREQYKCSVSGSTFWLEETGAGGSHDGEVCPEAGHAGVLNHIGSTFKEKYDCTACAVVVELPEPNAAGGSHVGQQHAACATNPKGTLKRKAPPVITETHTLVNGNKVAILSTVESGFNHVPVSSLGNPLGVAWNFDGTPELWGHESAHCRHMEHAGNAGSANNAQHDPTANAAFNWVTINETTVDGQQWDRACMMTYANHRPTYDPARDKRYPCGRCSLKFRGWKLAGVASPAAAVKDP
jgi:hypothetical protein